VSASPATVPESTSGLTEDEHRAAVALLVQYARFLDYLDGAAWSALFAEDGVLSFGDREITGREKLASFGQNSPRGVHIQGEAMFQRQPDGSVTCQSSFVFASTADGGVMAGWYTDRLVPDGNRFVFARRHIDIRARS
jgi:SnoaL-like domain